MNGARFRIQYGGTALRGLDTLPSKQRAQILRKIERLQQGLHGDIKHLREADIGYRLRMGNYRVLSVEGDIIVVRRVGDRKDIYD
jgi:mRNA-degrading endonuclease RelE of RelBE toxin-antitoxin system